MKNTYLIEKIILVLFGVFAPIVGLFASLLLIVRARNTYYSKNYFYLGIILLVYNIFLIAIFFLLGGNLTLLK